MIKIKLKKNIGYLVAYFFSWLLRKILGMIIQAKFSINPVYVYLYLMVLGEIMGGLLIYLYQYNSKKKRKKIRYFGIDLIYNKNTVGDNDFQIAFLIFLASFFDVFSYIHGTIFFPKEFSSCVDMRLYCTQTIASALIFIYVLKYKMKKHHKFSLIASSLCLLLTIIIDGVFKANNITLEKFCFAYFIIIFKDFCLSINNCIEKYLVDTNYINPFKVLSFEGLFGIIFSILASLVHGDLFKEIIDKYKEKDLGEFILLIFLLFLSFILSMILNAYKVYANIIFSPMERSLINYIFNPLFNIYYFVVRVDFNNNYYSFFLSEFICIIISFFGCIYNEYIILSYCNLDLETNYAIKKRATYIENIPSQNIDDLSSNFDED